MAQATEVAKPADDLEILFAGLSKADPGVADDSFNRHPGADRQTHALLERLPDVAYQGLVLRTLLVVHHDHGHARRPDRGRHLRIASQSPHVIHQVGPRPDRRGRHLGLVRIVRTWDTKHPPTRDEY